MIVEFEEEIILSIDAEGGGIYAKSGKIFQAQMKIAARGQFQPAVYSLLKESTYLAHLRIIKKVVGTSVRRSNDAGDAVIDGLLGHGDRLVKRPGAVVKTGKDVAVKINHASSYALQISLPRDT